MKKYIYLAILLLASFPFLVFAKTYSQEEIEKGSYVIDTYLFNKDKTDNYNGTLTTPMIILASKSIKSNSLNDMVIYYKVKQEFIFLLFLCFFNFFNILNIY
jgi:hypothetical protein